MEGGEEILKVMAGGLRRLLEQAALKFEYLQELRLRAGLPFLCQYDGKEYGFLESGRMVPAASFQAGHAGGGAPHVVSRKEVKETLEYLSSYSLYAYEEELRQGFLTIRGGHRIGLAGKAVLENGNIRTVRHISFLNIRLAHQILGCARRLLPYLYEEDSVCNTLLISPPGCGKTTLLRDMVRLISNGENGHAGMSIGVADERSELAACYQGVPQNDLGIRTDVLDNCPKAQGLMMLIRTMSPRVVAADEIGGYEDLDAVRYAGNCGCSVLATAHGATLEEIRGKPAFARIMEEGLFDRYILLGKKKKDTGWEVGHVRAVYDRNGQPMEYPV